MWKLPDNDFNYSLRWHQIKSYFTKNLIKQGVEITKDQRGEYPLWQRRFWEHRIRDESDLQAHIDYIDFNPVKHGYVPSSRIPVSIVMFRMEYCRKIGDMMVFNGD
nr:hypothetical protein [Legionella bononiensis]